MARYSDSPEEGRERRSLTWAVVFFLLSVILLYLPPSLQGQIAAGFRATLLRPFILTQEAVARVQRRAEDASQLQAQLDSMAGVIVSQGLLAEENRRLRGTLGIPDGIRQAFVPALVIRLGTVGSESMFLLNVGAEKGIKPGDPVLMREGGIGLVGVVKEARRGTAIGIDWSHPDFRASAMTADGGVFGLVEPVRGSFREEDRLLINGIPLYEPVEAGALIVTSGLGGVYPRGIPIGVVEELADQEGRWRKAYWLRPVVEVGSLTHVLVVVGGREAEELWGLFMEGRLPASDSSGAGGEGG